MMQLRDLIDIDFLQKFQDDFARGMGIASLIVDSFGNAVTRPSCFTHFCLDMVRSSPIGIQRCKECDLEGMKKAVQLGVPAVYTCHTGLTDFAAPIMLNGHILGAIYGGQVLTQPLNEDNMRTSARELGVDPDEYIATAREIKMVPMEMVQSAGKVLYTVANTLSRMAYQSLVLWERNRDLILTNNHLNNIFQNISEGVLIVEQSGIIQKVNPVVEQIFGRPAVELLHKPITELVGDKAACVLEQQKAYHDREIMVDNKFGRIHCMSSGTPIVDDQGNACGGVIILQPMENVHKLINRLSGAQATFRFSDIITQSEAMKEPLHLARLAAASLSNVLIEGESGTGKEVIAQSIHNHSSRSDGPFVAVNCGAIPRELISSELFGYTDGAFTGAKRGGRPGKFEMASGGTLFMDEIGDMPLEQQVALLRVLQDKKVTRIGDDKVIPVDVRVICATNKNLYDQVRKGQFRQDLYYRLNVMKITIPPLRERREDIPLLFRHFLEIIGHEYKIDFTNVEPEVMDYLLKYDWPGNVRELQNVVELMINMSDDATIRVEHLPVSILHQEDTQRASVSAPYIPVVEKEKYKQIIAEAEKKTIIGLLTHNRGNVSQVAKEMGISRNTLYRKMHRYNIMN